MKNAVVLGVAAHPDDLDYTCGGTVAKWVKEGAEVYYLVCTDGCKGSDDPEMTEGKLTEARKIEQKEASRVLGVKDVFFLDYKDTELVVDLKLKKEIVRYIRKLKPDIVITFDPSVIFSRDSGIINHSDHRAVGEATLDAVYPLARDRLIFPDLEFSVHKVRTIYLTNYDNPRDMEDVSDEYDLKIKALRAHISQINEDIIKTVTEQESRFGEKMNCKYAEGFVKLHLPF
jgi:LmbE family N-acetylglucosaminyl deacetylase